MLAKVIDKRSPFYGMICDVGHMTEEGLHRISEKGAAWHTGYAYADQLQPIVEFQPGEHVSVEMLRGTYTATIKEIVTDRDNEQGYLMEFDNSLTQATIYPNEVKSITKI